MRPFTQDFEFARFMGLEMLERSDGHCRMAIEIDPERHFNPIGIAHGGVAYSLADSAMGGALTTQLPEDKWCATLEIKFNYHVGVRAGLLTCTANILHRGKRIANLDARLFQHDRLVASANGNFAIFDAPSA